MDLRVGTTITLKLGPFVSQTDGVTPKTALSPTVKLSKNGAALAARNSATAITHDADGYYAVELNATDTNALGRLRVTVRDDANHLPVWQDFNVMSAAEYDVRYGAAFALTAASATTATFDAGASAVNDYYNGELLAIISGTGAGQVRLITDYDGGGKIATVSPAWATTPAAGSEFTTMPFSTSSNPTAIEIANEVETRGLSLSSTERTATSNALLDLTDAIETGLTLRGAMRLNTAAMAGKVSGAASSPILIRNAVSDSKVRITANVDASGNRASVTTDVT